MQFPVGMVGPKVNFQGANWPFSFRQWVNGTPFGGKILPLAPAALPGPVVTCRFSPERFVARFVARVLVPPPNVKFAPPRHGRKLPNSRGHHGSLKASAEICFPPKGRGFFFRGTCCYQVLPSDPFGCLTFSGVK